MQLEHKGGAYIEGCQLWQASMLALTAVRVVDLFACCKRSVWVIRNSQLHNHVNKAEKEAVILKINVTFCI